MNAPSIVVMGGTTREGSSTERLVQHIAGLLRTRGANVASLLGADLALPLYAPHEPARTPAARRLVETIRAADGVVIVTPSYHGSVSGHMKNALDYLEDLSKDGRAYLSGRPVGCVAAAYGIQGAASALASLRTIIHALRGWPTPLGVMVNTQTLGFDGPDYSGLSDPILAKQLDVLSQQVETFAAGALNTRLTNPDLQFV